jgi:hypothetical protein
MSKKSSGDAGIAWFPASRVATYESKYSVYPESEIQTTTEYEPCMKCLSRLMTIIEGFKIVDN